jgi:hypothetical protein
VTIYSCSLHFGTLAIEGIEANSEIEARQKAMDCFRPALLGIDEQSIYVKANKKEITPVITEPRIKLKLTKRKHAKRLVTVNVCRMIAEMAEEEIDL